MFKEFGLDSLADIDNGLLTEAFKQLRKYVVDDCVDRPGESKARTIDIRFEFIPKCDSVRVVDCDGVHVGVNMKAKLPDLKSKFYEMKPTRGGNLRFNVDNPEDADNPTLLDQPGADANN